MKCSYTKLAMAIMLSAGLISCGGGSGSDDEGPQPGGSTVALTSVVQNIDGDYIGSAQVCLDVDGDSACTDADREIKITDAGGQAVMNFTDDDLASGKRVIAVVSSGPSAGVSSTLINNAANGKIYINPLTTQLADYAEKNGVSFDRAAGDLASRLGGAAGIFSSELTPDSPAGVMVKALAAQNRSLADPDVLAKLDGALPKIETALGEGVTPDAVAGSYAKNGDFNNLPTGSDVEKNRPPVINGLTAEETGCRTLLFTADATDPDGNDLTYEWLFDDGTSVRQKNAERVFPASGQHSVTLSVSDGLAKAEQTRSFDVTGSLCGGDLEALFYAETTDGSKLVKFHNSSKGGAVKFRWDFGDNTVSELENPEHEYEFFGQYTVTLIVTDADGNESAPYEYQVTVKEGTSSPAPQPQATADGLTVTFTIDSQAQNVRWVFSDGTSLEGNTVTKTFPQAGTYPYTVMFDFDGATRTAQGEVTVAAANEPSADFEVSYAECGGEATFRAVLTNVASPSRYEWTFSDGVTGEGSEFSRALDAGAEYTVTLKVYGADGRVIAETTKKVTAGSGQACHDTPAFSFAVDGTSVTFTLDVTDGVKSVEWDFGDGSTSTELSPVHVYPNKDAEYDVSVTVVYDDGAEEYKSLTKKVTVKAGAPAENTPPVASADLKMSGLTLTYKSTSTDADNDALTYEWDFGDGAKATNASGTHDYASAGDYTVTLKVSDGKASDSYSGKVKAEQSSGGDFTIDFTYSFTGLTGKLTASVSLNDTSSTKYSWDFGDGQTSTEPSPTVTYATGGEKTVTLTVTDNGKTVTKSYTFTLTEGTAVTPQKKGIYYKGSASTIYIWVDDSTELAGPWPGSAMTTASEDPGWSFYDTSSITQSTINVIFSNNGDKLTGDLTGAPSAGCYDGAWTTLEECVLSGSAGGSVSGGGTVEKDPVPDPDPNPDPDPDPNPDPVPDPDPNSQEIDSNIPWNELEGAALDSTADGVDAVEAAPYLVASLNPGSYHADQKVALTAQDADRKTVAADIYYTLDNTEPTKSSTKYSGPITLADTSADGLGTAYRLRALVVGANGVSQEQHFFWFIKSQNPTPSAATDFRDETIYFVVTARFFDGDEDNNYYCRDRFDLTDPSWRGDFKGLIAKLDYIKKMGFTAIWITPPVENRSGLDYHGYHAYDWFQPDMRLESPGATYFDFIKAAHKKGIKVVQDVVLNHSSNYGIRGQTYIDKIPTKYHIDPQYGKGGIDMGGIYTGNIADYKSANRCDNDNPVAPTWHRRLCAGDPNADATFTVHFQDDDVPVTGTADTAHSGYYWSPAVSQSLPSKWYHEAYTNNWESVEEVQLRSMAGDCVDLTTENDNVRNYMNAMMKMYIDMGIDAVRIDTLKHMPREDVMAMTSKWQKYKTGLFVFGEALIKGFGDNTPEQLHPWYYTRTGSGTEKTGDSGISVLDFFLMSTFRDNVTKGSLGGLADVINRFDGWYADPTKLVTFFQNHDLTPDNTWSGSGAQHCCEDRTNAALAYNVLWTFRGIPVMYAGDETGSRVGLPPDLTGSNDLVSSTGRLYIGDDLDNGDPIIGHVTDLNAMRKASIALRRGQMKVLQGEPLVFERTYESDNAIVAIPGAGGGDVTVSGATDGSYVDLVTGASYQVSGGSVALGNIPGGSMRVLVKDYAGGKVASASQFLK